MDWTKFNNHGESNNHAFEVMCNLLFESWCRETYDTELVRFSFVNGDGGDGGVEAYGTLLDGRIIAVQSKWFPKKIDNEQINQINKSFQTAIEVRPNIEKYIVCVPRDLGSKRIVKGRKTTSNTELEKWDKLVNKCKLSNPNVELVLWDETTIQGKLTKPEALGIYRYWFDNTIVFDNLFKLSYEKVVNGWAKSKYIPEIHTAGFIHEKLEYFLGSVEVAKNRFEKTCEFINRLESLSRSYEDLLNLGLPKNMENLQNKLENDLKILQKWVNFFEFYKDQIKMGGKLRTIKEPLELNCFVSDINDSQLHFGKYFHFRDAEKFLENIYDDFYNLKYLLEDCDSNKIIFMGMQGTGKTAGIIAEASNFIQNGVHLPLIIHAKEYKEGDTWGSMIIKTLGLNSQWNEIELLGALQNAAFVKSQYKEEFFIEPQCVIIVDGIDEAISWKYWKDKIEEVSAFEKTFPRIKFVFLSRPYVFKNFYDLPYKDSFYLLPTTGDGDLEKMCDKYFEEYKIDIGDNFWIKKNLKTPMSIKLFSDIYRNTKITTLPQNTVVLTELYNAKIRSMEELYCATHKGFRGVKVIRIALIELAQLFAKNASIQYEDIYDSVSVQLKSSLNEILDFLTDEGFIYTYLELEDDFSVPKTFYSWGMQPAFDYLIAQKKYNLLSSDESLVIEQTDGIYQMLSLITIEKGKLITEYHNIKIDAQEAFELICYALSNCSINVAGKYTEYLKKYMRKSVASFREVFNKVIQMTLKSENHPLGSILLDDFLREFGNPAERDIWWSIPTYFIDNINSKWKSFVELDFDSIKLYKNDKWSAAPLTLVWSLSSVNNNVRQSSRYKLTTWGICQPLEYWKLFEKCVSINDIQILEDIFAVAYGIALNQFICEEYLITSSNWFLKNVFNKSGLKKFENVALRYYSAGIVKISISRGLLNSKITELITPPYKYDIECLPLCKDALESERMAGYQAIDYDLARYVLCDKLDDYFELDYKSKKYRTQVKEFIEKYKAINGLSELKIDGFIISLAYQFLLDQGWNKEDFWTYEDKNMVGIDIAIRRTYYASTHGEMSKIMTVAEKNVWLARHQLEAIFSNEIPLHDDNYETFLYVDDYSQVEDFINTYQDYANTIHKAKKHDWFNATLLASPDFEVMDKAKIENWINSNCTPQFEKWFSDYNGNTLLYTTTSVRNNLSGVSETIWISSGALEEKYFSEFLRLMDNYFEDRNDMLNVYSFKAYQNCQCYCSPQEACLVHSKREINSNLIISSHNYDINVLKFVEECVSVHSIDTEKYFILPSNMLRNLTNIVYGDGFSYSDNNGSVVATFSDDGESWGTYQKNLMIKSNILNSELAKNKFKMFWLFRVYREPSPKARERYDKLMKNSDRTYIIWKSGNHFDFKQLFPMNRNDENTNVNYDNKSILIKYGVLEDDEMNK